MILNKVINLSVNIFLGIILNFVVCIETNTLTFETFLMGNIISIGVGYFISDFFLVIGIGEKITTCINNKIIKKLIKTLITSIILVTSISFLTSFAMGGVTSIIMWMGYYPKLIFVGYIISLIFSPLLIRFIYKYYNKL